MSRQANARTVISRPSSPHPARRRRRRQQAAAADAPTVELDTRQDWDGRPPPRDGASRPLRPAGVRPAHRADRRPARHRDRPDRRAGSRPPSGPRRARPIARCVSGRAASGCCCPRPAIARRGRSRDRLDRTFQAAEDTRRLGAGLTIAIATAADHWTARGRLGRGRTPAVRGRRRRLVDERRHEVAELGRRIVAQPGMDL